MQRISHAWLALAGLTACTGDEAGQLDVPLHYEFQSRFEAGSSVSYTGQTFRHTLILGLAGHLGEMTERIDTGALAPTAGDVTAALDFYYAFDSAAAGSLPIGVMTSPPPLQLAWDDLSSGKDLQEKIAGADPVGQHRDWGAGIVGWDGAPTPDAFVRQSFAVIDTLAVDRAGGNIPLDPTGVPISAVFVTDSGVDHRQLLQKFLLGAVAFSQATDDYLDDDTAGKGLLSDNVAAEDGAGFTTLEHGWDEGFGYFGAARDYLDYSDDEIAGAGGRPDYDAGHHDTDGDGAIDLAAEINLGHALNAAKRDRDSVTPTDMTADAMQAFLTGRAIIAGTDGDLGADDLARLQAQRDIAVGAWEQAIAASVVHYINAVLQDMAAFETSGYDFGAHAKHWSEMKGFALSFQFNPRSPLSAGAFAELHGYLGTAPVLPGQPGAPEYRAALVTARTLLGAAYGFSPENLGDAEGLGGW